VQVPELILMLYRTEKCVYERNFFIFFILFYFIFIVAPFILISSKSVIYQQMNFVSVLENTKHYVKTYIKNCCYMFRSTTIIRELTYEPS